MNRINIVCKSDGSLFGVAPNVYHWLLSEENDGFWVLSKHSVRGTEVEFYPLQRYSFEPIKPVNPCGHDCTDAYGVFGCAECPQNTSMAMKRPSPEEQGKETK